MRNFEIIEGSDADDEIHGDAANNILRGGDADDIIDGRGGNDTLVGGEGDDWLTGGAGSDRLVFDEAGLDGEGDVITDFVRGEDKLVIERAAFEIAAGDTAVTLATGTEPPPWAGRAPSCSKRTMVASGSMPTGQAPTPICNWSPSCRTSGPSRRATLRFCDVASTLLTRNWAEGVQSAEARVPPVRPSHITHARRRFRTRFVARR
ncbi:hypothetical protein AU381_19030 [Sinorhizobium glycinis]|uniref:Calcium-binding protein n=1 Tax=Sinorhizobium glycinis TaxID=1472378 RepID=A0A178XN05_9HYPH|nr:hypothetical protein [Sinorhizobium glycinis]OAP36586.1 hypothetical protein AU381_19030 [Sinorhizobium glycinis]